MSTICSSFSGPTCASSQHTRKSTHAPSATALVNRREAITAIEDGEGDEREEPRNVEIEPVRQDDLEADEEGGGERGEAQRRAHAHERDDDGGEHEKRLEHLLDEVQVGNPRRVVLAPAPDRERRL